MIFSFIAFGAFNCVDAADLGTDSQKDQGKVLYEKYCLQCHGEKGDGKGPGEDFFKPKPRDFTSGKYKVRTTLNGELPTDQDIFNAIKHGLAFRNDGAYTGMPPWPQLKEDEIKNLVYYLKSFSKDFSDSTYNNPKTVTIPKAPPYSEDSAKKGVEVFEKNECIKCHGSLGRGDGKSALTTKDDWGNHIRPADLSKPWTFRGGSNREDIFRTISTGFNGTPMPSYLDTISEEDRWHLVDYIYSLSNRKDPSYSQPDRPIVVEPLTQKFDYTDFKSAELLFASISTSYIPIIGQVIEPGREFYPGVNEVEVKAVYNQEDVAIMIKWHDLRADIEGKNAPDIDVSVLEGKQEAEAKSTDEEESKEEDPFGEVESDPFGEEGGGGGEDKPSEFSDAVAIQIPARGVEGFKLPYFIYGDSGFPVHLWFADLAQKEAKTYLGKGSASLSLVNESSVSYISDYQEGEWTVIFKRPLKVEDGFSMDLEKTFVPVAFSIWDGFNEERGNKRGLSAWFSLYFKEKETPSPIGPMLMYGFGLLFLEVVLVCLLRRKYGSKL